MARSEKVNRNQWCHPTVYVLNHSLVEGVNEHPARVVLEYHFSVDTHTHALRDVMFCEM